MYIHRDLQMARRQRGQLEALQAELGLPMRVLKGDGACNYIVPAWHATHTAANEGFTQDECRDTGITIVPWASFHPTRWEMWDYPGDRGVFTTDRDYAYQYYDCLEMPENEGDWIAAPVTLEDGETTIGEMVDRTILLKYNWFYYEQFRTQEILSAVISASLDPERAAEFAARRAQVVLDRFVKYAQRSSNLGLDTLRNEVGALMTRHNNAVRDAARYKVELRQKQKFLDALLGEGTSASEQQLLDTWAQMLDDPRIEDVTFDSGERLVITTVGQMLTHPNTGESVYLGKMRWRISVTDSLCEVQNLDNARGGYDHPHVFMNQPCFGDLGDTIYTLIKQGNLWPAVEMIFAFLGSINLNDDWGRRAAYWFEDPMDSPRNADDPPTAEPTDVTDEVYDEDELAATLADPVPA